MRANISPAMKMSASDFVEKVDNNFTLKIAISVLPVVFREHTYQYKKQLVSNLAPMKSTSQKIIHVARKVV